MPGSLFGRSRPAETLRITEMLRQETAGGVLAGSVPAALLAGLTLGVRNRTYRDQAR